MSIIARPGVRVAKCGHEYLSNATAGRQRTYGDCGCAQVETRSTSASQRGRKASEARWSKAGRATECLHCSGALPESGWSSYCSRLCRQRASYQRRKARIAAEQKALRAEARAAVRKCCPNCDEPFIPGRSMKQRFCSPRCSKAFYRDRADVKCSEVDCGRPVRARNMCSMHWRRWARAEGNEVNPEWDDRRRANYHKRRALKRELPADDIRPLDVYERDEWTCGLCSEAVPRDAKWPEPLSPSLDHVVPLTKGGHHIMENVQLAHLACNVRKGDRIEADAMLA